MGSGERWQPGAECMKSLAGVGGELRLTWKPVMVTRAVPAGAFREDAWGRAGWNRARSHP